MSRYFRFGRVVFIVVLGALLLGLAPSAQAATPIHVRTGGDDTVCDGTDDVDYDGTNAPDCAVQTIQKGIDLVAAGDTVYVRSGTYVLSAQVNVNKAGITLDGDGVGSTIVQVSGAGYGFYVTVDGVTIQDMEIQKTDKTGTQNIIYIGSDNVSVTSCKIFGQYADGDGDVSRAFEVAYGTTGLAINSNTIYALRQPGYLNGSTASPTTGSIQNNSVYGTKGWVLAGAAPTFTGNTWGTGNVFDIVILDMTDSSYYPDIVALSDANNEAVVEDQRPSPDVLSVVLVDDGAASGGDGGRLHPYQTVGAAVTRVVAGGRIWVAAGTYSERVTIGKSMDLRGAQYGVDPTPSGARSTSAAESIITEAGLSTPNPDILIEIPSGVTDVSVDGFTLIGDPTNATADTSVIRAWDDDLIIANNIVDGWFGLIYKGNDRFDFDSNRVTVNKTGLAVQPSPATYVAVSGSTFAKGTSPASDAQAIYISGCTDCSVTGNAASGFANGNGVGGSNLTRLLVSGNTFAGNKKGVNIWGNSTYVTIEDNSLTGSVEMGVNIKGQDIAIKNNFVTGGAAGISVAVNSITTERVTIAENDLSANTGLALAVAPDVTGTVDASGNWWGVATPAGVAAEISGAADYTPWLAVGTDASADPGFQGDFSTLWVDDDSPQTGTTGRIQEGIDLVTASTVNVAPGTYYEQVTIDKSVTLLGDPGDSTPGPGANAPAIDGGSSPGSAFFIENGVSNVVIKGFEMRNFTSNGSGVGNGISAWEASTSNITIQDNYFHDLEYNGVLVGNDGAIGDHTNWLIKGNVAERLDYIAFELTNTSDSSIEGNVIHLDSPEIGAIFSSARRSESGLTIADNVIDGTPSALFPVVYVYAYDNDVANPNLDGLLIEGNAISTSGTPYQVYIRNINTGTVTGVEVHNNSLSALKSTTAETVDASGNWWGVATPAGVSAKISGAVDHTPWLAVGTDTSVDIGFQGDFSTLWVDDDGEQTGTTGRIQEGIDLVTASTVNVAAGTYIEDVSIGKALTLSGAGIDQSIIKGLKTGTASATVRVATNAGVLIEGFTVTRDGNNTTDWSSNVKMVGLAIQGSAGNVEVRNNKFVGNRSGIDLNFTAGNSIHNNVIDFNRTGMILRNQCPNNAITENDFTNNWTIGILWLAASTEDATGTTFFNNKIAGNWYTQIENRSLTGGVKNFTGNWLGSTALTTASTNGAEPGYTAQIPVEYGGAATPPGGAISVRGVGIADMDYTPWLGSGTDTDVDNGTGTVAFQGDFSDLYVTAAHGQTGTTGRIQEGIDLVSGSTVNVVAGTYIEDLVIDKAVTLLGPNASINPNTGTRVAEAILLPAVSAPDPDVCEVMAYLEVSDITIKGFTFDGDNPALTSGVIIDGADVDACEILAGYEGMGNIVVENNILKHSTYSAIDFYNYTNSAATAGNYIRYNRIEDVGETTYNWGIGILAYNNFYADITDNVLTGVRTGVQTGNYFNANPGTTGSISNNEIGVWRLGIFHNLAYSSASAFTISGNAITAETYTGATKWSGLLLSSIGGAVNATITGNDITIPSSVSFAAPGYTAGYNVWNVTTSAPIAIAGGTVTGGDYGVFVNNFEGYVSNADNTAVKVDGVTITGSDIAGVYVKDSPDNSNHATVYANIQNCSIDTDSTGILVEGSDATAKANLNLLGSNPTAGATNTSGNLMDAECNYWGAADGPGPVGAGAGSGVSTVVDFQPWANADLSACTGTIPAAVTMEVSGSPAPVYGVVTMDTRITADDVYGIVLNVQYDDTELEFQSATSTYNDVAGAGWYWDYPIENFALVSGGRRLSGTMTDPPHADTAMLNGESVSTWKFKCLQEGTHSLTFNTDTGTGTELSDKDGGKISFTANNATVSCISTAEVDGYIKLQGRVQGAALPAGWQGAKVVLTCADTSGGCAGYGPYEMTTDEYGYYQWVKSGPGTGIVYGTYTATVTRRAYLGATKGTTVVIAAPSTTINLLATAPRLLGGEVAGDDSKIDIADLSAIAGLFATPIAADTGADVNGDGWVSIYDLSIAGGNFYKTTSNWP